MNTLAWKIIIKYMQQGKKKGGGGKNDKVGLLNKGSIQLLKSFFRWVLYIYLSIYLYDLMV